MTATGLITMTVIVRQRHYLANRNLQKIGKLKAEPPDQLEFDGLVT